MHLKIKSLDKVIIILAIIGLILSVITTINYYSEKELFCAPTEKTDCSIVSNSKFATFFGIYVGVLGVVAFIILNIGLIFKDRVKKILHFRENDFRKYLLIFTLLMAAFSTYLTLVEEIIIKRYCVLCIFVFITTLLILILVWETWRLSKHITID